MARTGMEYGGITPIGDAGSFATTIAHPATAGGVVALRVSATDSDGNSVVQTIPEAYRLK